MPSPNPVVVAPSILGGDHAALGQSLEIIRRSGANWVHLDIMDGHFVPNLSFGPGVVRALRPKNDLFFDVHLMLDNPECFIEAFARAGANQITIHAEPDYPVAAALETIRKLDCRVGIAINPKTSLDRARPFLELCHTLLLMSVQPGFGGQSFDTDVLEKIRAADAWRRDSNLDFRIEVDGGIDLQTAPGCLAAGADTLVAGTAFFKAEDPAVFVRNICP